MSEYPRTDDRVGLYGAKRKEQSEWVLCDCGKWYKPDFDEKRCEVCEREEDDSD